ncbi:Ig-like domain-containing protein [Pontibacter mangrovi]|uniref:Ig-like domain-containing protein n=1 Tax=Pontibacter mangrovi TaxID=2589816 RepID=UPI0015E388B5|nr:T9SS type A sorting domain-containing protein [Pontibacter mangrovi]
MSLKKSLRLHTKLALALFSFLVCFISTATGQTLRSACAGKQETFTATYTGSSNNTRWQSSTNGNNWSNVTSGTSFGPNRTMTCTVTAAPNLDGRRYRAQYRSGRNWITISTFQLAVATAPPAGPLVSAAPACPGSSTTLLVTSPDNSFTYRWYTAPNGGGSVHTGTSFTTPALSSPDTYYVAAENACGTSARTAVPVTISQLPASPTANDNARTGPGPVTLRAAGAPAGGSYRWFLSDGTLINGATGDSYTTPTLSSTTTYYVASLNAQGCESSRVAVTATVLPASPPNTYCAGESVPLAVPQPTIFEEQRNLQWQVSTDGESWEDIKGATLNDYTVIASQANNGYSYRAQYEYRYWFFGWSSWTTETSPVTQVLVSPTPAPPTTSGASHCGEGMVTLTASGSTGSYRWYEAMAGGAPVASGAEFQTMITTNTTFYVAAVNANGCESIRRAVTASVGPTTRGGSRTDAGPVELFAAGAPAGGSYRWYTQPSGGSPISDVSGGLYTPVVSTTTTYYVSILTTDCESTRTPVTATITPASFTGNLGSNVILFHENFSGYSGNAPGMGAGGGQWDLKPVLDAPGNSTAAQASGRHYIRTSASSGASTRSLTLDDALSTKGYEQIGVIWSHRSTFEDQPDRRPSLSFSTDNGSTWRRVSGWTNNLSTSWTWANNGNYITLPAEASDAASLMLRWEVANHPVGAAYYAVDDITVIGTPTSGLNTFSWSSRPEGEDPFVISEQYPEEYTVDGVALTWSIETLNTAPSVRKVTSSQYQSTPVLAIVQTGANDQDNKTVISLDLSSPVQDLTFSILDVDRQQGQFRDDLEILGYNAGAPVSLDKKNVIHTSHQDFTGGRITSLTDYNDVASDSGEGNVTVTFRQAVDRVVINYRNAEASGNQGIGIHDLKWGTPIITPLPVELASFSAKAQQNQVVLNWRTASELNNDRFEVERSQDGRSFSRIGSVQGKGTTIQPNAYLFRDRNPGTGVNYYRLRQVDHDGTYEYSKTVFVHIKSTAVSVKAFPNPFTDFVRLELTSEETGPALALVLDGQGRVILEQQFQVAERYTTLELPTRDLAAGLYFLKVKGAGIDATTKLIKQR